MKTAKSPKAAAPPPAKARFLEIKAGRLRSEEPREAFSSRLALSKRFSGEPTD